VGFRLKVAALSAGALLASGGGVAAVVASSAPAQASQVNNMMLCEPDTGWCYQTNPPYNPAFPHSCQWDYRLHNLHSGMYYTGCTAGYWGPDIH
jgi:hypothetical protein